MTDEPSAALRERDVAGASDSTLAEQAAPVLPHEPRTVLLAAILALLVFYTLYFTAEIVVPLVFALLLRLLLQPGARALTRLRVPQPVAALAMMAILFCLLAALSYGLSAPAVAWLGKAPESLPRLGEHLSDLRQPLDRFLNLTHKVEELAEAPAGGPSAVAIQGSGLAGYLFSGTRSILTELGITALLLFFLLASGDLFMRKLVEILPTFHDKRQAVEIAREIESGISSYLVTITVMNLLVGTATGLAMWAIGIPDPALWGALAFLLNYVLILGPLAGVVIFGGVGLLTFPSLWHAALPPAAFLAIHIVEGAAVTPLLVARRFTLNPVLVIGSLVFWDWMWGIPGALLAVPVLATVKIVADRVRPLMAIGHFIGG